MAKKQSYITDDQFQNGEIANDPTYFPNGVESISAEYETVPAGSVRFGLVRQTLIKIMLL